MIFGEIEPIITLFTDDCIIYRKITDNKDMEKSQIDQNSLARRVGF
jgi:hypothetical protein